MKFTVVLIGLLSVTSSWASKEKKSEDPKDKREAPIGYPSSGHSSHTLQIQNSQGNDGGQAISIGAGYSVGGAKPSFGYSAPALSYQLGQQSQPTSGGHSTIQLAPITIQPEHGNLMSSSDLSQLMNQLTHGLSTGAISLQPAEQSYQVGAQAYQGGAEQSALPQFSYGSPKYTLAVPSSGASYSAGTKGLGSYSSTGPVLFTPSLGGQSGQGQTLSYGNNFQSLGDSSSLAGLSLGNSGLHSVGVSSGYGLGGAGGLSLGGGHSLGNSGGLSLGGSNAHSFGSLGGLSLGGSAGHNLGGGSGYSLGSLSLGGGSHSFGGSNKLLGGNYGAPSKAAFKPSAFLGSSVGDSTHSLSAISSSYSAPSFSHSFAGGQGGSSLGSSGHTPSFGGSYPGFGSGSSKFGATSYIPSKSEGFGSSLESVAAFSSGSQGHASSPPSTTYGMPSASYLPSSSSHSSSSPQHYISSSKYPSTSSFGEGSSSYKSPSFHSGHSVSSFSSGPRYNFGGLNSPSSHYGSPKDAQGAYSETSYNTIKYSEELKPHSH